MLGNNNGACRPDWTLVGVSACWQCRRAYHFLSPLRRDLGVTLARLRLETRSIWWAGPLSVRRTSSVRPLQAPCVSPRKSHWLWTCQTQLDTSSEQTLPPTLRSPSLSLFVFLALTVSLSIYLALALNVFSLVPSLSICSSVRLVNPNRLAPPGSERSDG